MDGRKSVVVISHLPPGTDLRRDHVALPSNYGSSAYFARSDIQAIYRLVNENLSALDARLHFSQRMAGQHVLFKPNLVTVYHHMGLVEPEYPETTDPRLLDAVLAYFKRFTSRLTIIESSGRGVPTRGSFAVSGLERLAGADVHVHAAAPPLLDQALVDQLLVALEHRQRVEAELGGDAADRGQRVAFLEHPFEDHRDHPVPQLAAAGLNINAAPHAYRAADAVVRQFCLERLDAFFGGGAAAKASRGIKRDQVDVAQHLSLIHISEPTRPY